MGNREANFQLCALIVTKYHSQSKTVSCQLIMPLSQWSWGRRVSIKCIAFTTNLLVFVLFYNCFESLFGELQFRDTFQIHKFLRWKKLRDSWDCWQEKNVLVATATAGEGAREQLRIVGWSRHTITDYTLLQLSWQLTSQSSTGRHKKWFVSNHRYRVSLRNRL